MKYLFLLLFVSLSAFSFENCPSDNLNELEACSVENYKEEDSKLNYLYNEIINTYPELKVSVKNNQKLWIKARDSICAYNETDGDEYKVYQNSCLYEQTYERNRELKAIVLRQTSKLNKNTQTPLWNEYVKSHCAFMQKNYSDNECLARNNFLHTQE